MKWLNNLENLATNENVGSCPFCNSSDTDYSIKSACENSDIGYGDIWCNSCKKAFHISRIIVTDSILRDIPIPNDLSY